jgi:hypothetical protein
MSYKILIDRDVKPHVSETKVAELCSGLPNVDLWRLAKMTTAMTYVGFWHKADMGYSLQMSAFEVKRT